MKHYMKDGSETFRFIKVTVLMVAVVGVVALFVGIPTLKAGGPPKLKATAILFPTGAAGTNVSGKITFTDDGSGVTVKGKAKGLVDGDFSLLYDILSVSTGDRPCIPGRLRGVTFGAAPDGRLDPANLTDEEMGEVAPNELLWDVSPNGNGKLRGTVPVGLDKVRTISIRRLFAGAGRSTVMACGLIVVK